MPIYCAMKNCSIRFRIREEKSNEYRSFQAREAEKPRGNPLSVLLVRKRWINNNLKRTSCLKEAAVRRQFSLFLFPQKKKEKRAFQRLNW